MPGTPTSEPVEVGQVRRGQFGINWGVIKAHPTRKGFWICASHEFPFDIITVGRRQLESLPLIPDGYYKEGHPGINYWQTFLSMKEIKRD
jgi:hypothetical protein